MGSSFQITANELNFLESYLKKMEFGKIETIESAGSAGSGRKFYRIFLENRKTFILMVWDSIDVDWEFFFELHKIEGVSKITPSILDEDPKQGFILLEDGGIIRLKDTLFSAQSEKESIDIFKEVIDSLIKLQNIKLPQNCKTVSRELDYSQFIWETSYFAEHILALFPSLITLFNSKWESEREELASSVNKIEKKLCHRDFQSENILLNKGNISFVDIQGARPASPYYDLASLLFDPYIYSQMSLKIKEKSLNYYSKVCGFDFVHDDFNKSAMQRLMQALGAFGNLSLNRGKKEYLKYVTPALENLLVVLTDTNGYNQIKKIVDMALVESKSNRGKND